MAESNNTANLGCGTIILIALIVLIFGNKNDELVKEIKTLREDVQQLTEEVKKLQPLEAEAFEPGQ